ncbi:MAG: carboxypeptidase regulatory-like domain-containing protein [Armatimonadota bacterium]
MHPSRMNFRYRSLPRVLTLCLVAALAALGGARPGDAAGNTYYVAPGGNDGWNGSQSAPFRQIRRALQVVRAGDTVLVADGSYLGFDASLTGTASAPITIRAVGSNAVVTPTTDRGDDRDNIHVMSSAYVVLDGLRSFNGPRSAVRINTSHHVTVRNGVYGDNGTWGIFTNHSDDLLIERNTCYGSKIEHGIYASNSGDRPIIRRNVVYNNAANGIHVNGDRYAGGDGLITGALIEYNVVYNNGVKGGSGINMDGVQYSTVRNNLLFNNHATGIACYQGGGAAGPRGMQILHNTIDMASDARWALQFLATTGPNVVRNNVLYNRNTAKGGLEFGNYTDVQNVDTDYNVLDRVTTDYGSSVMTLAQWQGHGKDRSSFSAAPSSLFVNPAAGDYHLLSSAPVVNRGQTLTSVQDDLDGKVRPQGTSSDIGCYELAGSTPSTYTLSGKVTLGSSGLAGVTLTSGSRTVTTGSDGSYAFTGLPTASYTVTPSKSGYTFSPTSQTVTLGSNQTAVNFTASTTMSPQSGFLRGVNLYGPAVTIEGNRWLSFADAKVQGLSVSGAGTWSGSYSFPLSPSADADTKTMLQSCVYSGSRFNVRQVLANGEYDVYLWTIENYQSNYRSLDIRVEGALVASGLGNLPLGSWRKYGPYRASVKDGALDLEVSRTRGDAVLMGFALFGSGSTPTPTTYSLSGRVTLGTGGLAGATVKTSSLTVISGTDGSYTFSGLAAGTYTVSASKSGYTVSPASRSVTVGPSQTGVDFAATAIAPATYRLAGKVTLDTAGLSGVLVQAGTQSVSTGADGSYAFSGLAAGSYTVKASKSGYTFSPASQAVTLGPDKSGVNFAATAVPSSSGYFRGINLGGPAVTIGGQRWLSHSEALGQGLSVSGAGTWSGSYTFPLSPSADTDTRTMLQSCLYSESKFNLRQALPSGQYDVYLWTIENWRSSYRSLSVRAEGATVASGIGTLPLGSWRKYGPYRVTVQDGSLDLEVARAYGDAVLFGLSIQGAGQ